MRISVGSSDVCSSDLLFVAKGVDGVGARHREGVAGDGADGDGEGEYRRQHEGAGPEVDARVEAVEPIPHRPPGDRPGDEVGYDDGLGELPGEQPHDVAAAGAHHLADADLLSPRSEEHTSELQSLMRISYAVFCLKKKTKKYYKKPLRYTHKQ